MYLHERDNQLLSFDAQTGARLSSTELDLGGQEADIDFVHAHPDGPASVVVCDTIRCAVLRVH